MCAPILLGRFSQSVRRINGAPWRQMSALCQKRTSRVMVMDEGAEAD